MNVLSMTILTTTETKKGLNVIDLFSLICYNIFRGDFMCIFCKIIKGEIPSYKVYEDENFLAFLDISQTTIGHTLIVPKDHFSNIFELSEDCNIFKIVIKVAKALKESLGISSINILNNNGEVAGQTVNHFHIHLIPRYNNDNFKINFPVNQLTKEEFETLMHKIKNKLK